MILSRLVLAGVTGVALLGLLGTSGVGQEGSENDPDGSRTPVRSSQDPTGSSGAKWGLWAEGTLLRGADLHPCRVFDTTGCRDVLRKKDVQALRDAGANLVNASYPGVFSVAAPYGPDRENLDRLDTLIGWAEEVGIFVVIHFRTGPGRNEDAIHLATGSVHEVWTDQAAHDAWVDMWRFTAERYRTSPVVVGYHLMVEPNANILFDATGSMEPAATHEQMQGTLADWNTVAAEISAAIREVDPETPIIVSSLDWASTAWFDVLRPTGDPYTVYSLHAYDPDVYTGQEAEQDELHYPDVVEDGGETIVFDQRWLEANLQPAVRFAERHEVPIYVAEFGVMRWVPGADRFLQDQMDLFEGLGWNHGLYVWRGDEPGFDGFNMEFGPDPTNHSRAPGNRLLQVIRDHWMRNDTFPDTGSVDS